MPAAMRTMALPFRLLAGGFAALVLTTAAAERDDHAAARERFPLVWEAAQHGPDRAWRKLAVGLEHYPLFPYLELAALERRKSELTRAEVDAFLARWPDSLPAELLRGEFLAELARRADWKDFVDLYTGTERSTELRCAALAAHLALGAPPDFARDVEPLWRSAKPLPAACDPVVDWARRTGELTAARIWQRIDAAAQAGQAELVTTLAGWLDGADRAAAERTALAIRDPAAALNQAASWPDAPHARAAAVVAFVRLARRDSDAAEAQWNALATHFAWDAEQRGRILRAIAVQRAASYAPDALTRLADLPDDADDDASREWRVRAALAAQDWRAALAGLERMTPAQQTDARWRYLRARTLTKLDRENDAAPLFAALAREANFHGFLAADWLDRPYTICARDPDLDAAATAVVRRQPDLARAFEFFALGRLPEARREWDFALAKLDARERRAAAVRASELGWYDRAVYTFNQGEDQHLYALRFPLARRDAIERAAHAAGIDPAWAYAIIRAESAFTTDARSGADAYGLMQLLPGTARQLAKVEKVSFSSPTALFDPDLNIRLGTRYLAALATRHDGSPWLATAAYDAGEDPLGRWIEARDALEPDFFIETIPYKETREYVARVLAFSVIYDWRLTGAAQPLAARLPRIGQAYEPAGDAARKAVVCPAPASVETAAVSSSAKR
jgi:soluble lytic murein transglycosylase